MGFVTKLGARSTLLSLIEVVVFFAIITTAYFAAVSVLYRGLAGWAVAPPEGSGGGPFWASAPRWLGWVLGSLPAWMYFLEGVGYLALITVYWAPVDEQADVVEVRAFGVFLLGVMLTTGLVLWRTLGL